MTVMRDIPYEEWSAFINQTPSGMSGEAEGERSYWLCQLSLDRITILLSDTITISHPKSLSTMKSSDAIHAAMREPLARLTSTSYGAYFNCITPVLFVLTLTLSFFLILYLPLFSSYLSFSYFQTLSSFISLPILFSASLPLYLYLCLSLTLSHFQFYSLLSFLVQCVFQYC